MAATMEDVEKTSPTEEIITLPRTTGITTTTGRTSVRPPIDYSSGSAFRKSVAARWKSIWTKNFILALLAGQLLSLCITCTSVTTTELINRGWTLSTTQGFFLWVDLIMLWLCLLIINKVLFLVHHLYAVHNLPVYVLFLSMTDLCWAWQLLDGISGWGKMIFKDGWKCACLSICNIWEPDFHGL